MPIRWIAWLSPVLFLCYHVFGEKNVPVKYGTLSAGGNVRLRYEFMNNYSLKAFGSGKNDDVLYERIKLNLDYRTAGSFRIFFEAYDARFWLNEYHAADFSPSCSHQNPYDIKQLFLERSPTPNLPVGIKIGRQELSYGDIRIWGPGDWSNSGKYNWDAAKLLIKLNRIDLDVIYTRQVISDPEKFDTDHFDFHAGGLYSSIKRLPFVVEAFYVTKYQPEETGAPGLWVHTAGIHVKGALSPVDYEATIAAQVGKKAEKSIRALGTNLFAAYSFNVPLKPRVVLGHTYASGDRDPNDGVEQTFDGVFGAAARHYGRMNQFFWMNIHDAQADIEAKPVMGTKVVLSGHKFWLAQSKDAWYKTSGKTSRKDVLGRSGTGLGEEIDVYVKSAIGKYFEIFTGYARLFAGPYIENTGTGGDADWFFFQSTFKW